MTEAEKVSLSVLAGESLDVVKDALDALARNYSAPEAAAIEAKLLAYVAAYSPVENKHLRVSGGRDGIDLDYGRDRRDLRAKARELLELPAASPGLFRLDVVGSACVEG